MFARVSAAVLGLVGGALMSSSLWTGDNAVRIQLADLSGPFVVNDSQEEVSRLVELVTYGDSELSALIDQANAYTAANRLREAETYAQAAVEFAEQSLAGGDPLLGVAMNTQATVYRHQGRFRDATISLQRAFAVYDRAIPPTHPYYIAALVNLAALHASQNLPVEAVHYYERALSIIETSLGLDDPSLRVILVKLAELYEIQGRHEDANRFYKRSLDLDANGS